MNHRVMILDQPGEHWRCECGKWTYDSETTLDDEGFVRMVRTHVAHVRAEGGEE